MGFYEWIIIHDFRSRFAWNNDPRYGFRFLINMHIRTSKCNPRTEFIFMIKRYRFLKINKKYFNLLRNVINMLWKYHTTAASGILLCPLTPASHLTTPAPQPLQPSLQPLPSNFFKINKLWINKTKFTFNKITPCNPPCNPCLWPHATLGTTSAP